MEQVEKLVTWNPISWLAWVLSLPIRILAWVISTIRARLYDPESIICPACGFRGDKGTNGKTMRINFVRTQGAEKAAIQHTCFRCGCNEIYSKIFSPADTWLPKQENLQLAKLKQAAAKEQL